MIKEDLEFLDAACFILYCSCSTMVYKIIYFPGVSKAVGWYQNLWYGVSDSVGGFKDPEV